MQMSIPTLTGISSMKIIRKIPGMKESSASIQLFNFTLDLKCNSINKTVMWERFLYIPKLGNQIYTTNHVFQLLPHFLVLQRKYFFLVNRTQYAYRINFHQFKNKWKERS